MIAVLYAIWLFLVALGPFLTSIGGILAAIATALWELAKLYAIAMLFLAAFEILFDPRGKERVGNFLGNVVGGALGMAQPLLTALTPSLHGIVQAFATAFATTGPSLATTVAAPAGAFAASNFNTTIAALEKVAESTPDNAVQQAALAIADAFGKGISSAAVTAAFESMFPEKLNTLNGIGPMLAQMAGFGDVSEAVRGPLYRAAFGKSAEYLFNARFTQNLPDAHTAAQWLARGIITAAQYNILYVAAGLKPEWFAAQTEAAYRPVSPRAVQRAAEIGALAPGDLTSIMKFSGIRDSDQSILLESWDALMLQPYRNTALAASKRAFERGYRSPADFQSDMDYLKVPTEAQIIVQLDCAIWKLEQLGDLYRKSVSEAYKTGQITDAQYIPALLAIGIDAGYPPGHTPDASAHYAVDSIARSGKIMLAAERAAEKLTRQEQAAGVKAAIKTFQVGGFGPVSAVAAAQGSGAGAEASLLAALIATGLDPSIAGFAVEYQVARLAGNVVYVYGLELTRDDALVLKEKVAALADQYRKQLIDDKTAASAVADLGIPDANARALLATWAAMKVAPTTHGVLLPR